MDVRVWLERFGCDERGMQEVEIGVADQAGS